MPAPNYSIQELRIIAEEIADSGLFKLSKSQAFTICLMGQARGIHPIDAVIRFPVVNRRPSMSAEAMQAEFQQRGGSVEWVTSTSTEVHAIFKHPKFAPKGFEVELTLDELVETGVAGYIDDKGEVHLKDLYRKHPDAMLRARCVSKGVRAVDPGAILGCYTPEEIRDFAPASPSLTDEEETVAEPPTLPAPSRQGRRRRECDGKAHLNVIETACNDVNKDWGGDLEDYNLKGELPDVVATVEEVRDYLGTWALANKPLPVTYLDDEKGERSPDKLAKLLSRWHAKHLAEFQDLVYSYCIDKLNQARRDARMDVYVSDESEFNAEEENQEAANATEDVAEVSGELAHT